MTFMILFYVMIPYLNRTNCKITTVEECVWFSLSPRRDEFDDFCGWDYLRDKFRNIEHPKTLWSAPASKVERKNNRIFGRQKMGSSSKNSKGGYTVAEIFPMKLVIWLVIIKIWHHVLKNVKIFNFSYPEKTLLKYFCNWKSTISKKLYAKHALKSKPYLTAS